MDAAGTARLVLADHPHLDRLWWRLDTGSRQNGIIVTCDEPDGDGWQVVERTHPS